MTNYPSVAQIAEMVKQLTQARIENWWVESLGTWRWWVLLALLFVPGLVWYKVVNKKQIHELVMFGLIVMVFTITLDEFGSVMSYWIYPIQVIPMFPRLSPIDYSVVPVTYMLLYQYFPTWKSFFWALVAVSAVFSFVIEPIIAKLGFYLLIKWTYWASFIVYIPMGLLSRWIARMFLDIAREAQEK